MSAFICDREHFLYLVTAAVSPTLNPHGGAFRWNHDGPGQSKAIQDGGCFELMADAANMLLLENMKSVSHRYPGGSSATLPGPVGGVPVFTPDHMSAGLFWEINPVQVLKSCDCYEYQSCEHDGWKGSEAHDFIDGIRRRAIHALPGYEAAEWGHPERKRTRRTR